MNFTSKSTILFMLIFIAGLAFLVGYVLQPDPERIVVDKITNHYDTTIVYIPVAPDTLHLTARADTIVYTRTDTLILTMPFVAVGDTNVKSAGAEHNIKWEYEFPHHNLMMTLQCMKDSIPVPFVTVLKEIEILKPRPWYELPTWTAGGLLIGYGLGSIGGK